MLFSSYSFELKKIMKNDSLQMNITEALTRHDELSKVAKGRYFTPEMAAQPIDTEKLKEVAGKMYQLRNFTTPSGDSTFPFKNDQAQMQLSYIGGIVGMMLNEEYTSLLIEGFGLKTFDELIPICSNAFMTLSNDSIKPALIEESTKDILHDLAGLYRQLFSQMYSSEAWQAWDNTGMRETITGAVRHLISGVKDYENIMPWIIQMVNGSVFSEDVAKQMILLTGMHSENTIDSAFRLLRIKK